MRVRVLAPACHGGGKWAKDLNQLATGVVRTTREGAAYRELVVLEWGAAANGEGGWEVELCEAASVHVEIELVGKGVTVFALVLV